LKSHIGAGKGMGSTAGNGCMTPSGFLSLQRTPVWLSADLSVSLKWTGRLVSSSHPFAKNGRAKKEKQFAPTFRTVSLQFQWNGQRISDWVNTGL
jgi:hypothetical protein